MFSPELINRITEYFERCFGVVVTPEQAEEYLHSLGELYLCFAEIIEDGAGGGAPPEGRASPPADLISPHSCN